MAGQPGFFDLSDRYASLDAKKDPLVENQAKTILYGQATMPRIVGKLDEDGVAMIPADEQLEPVQLAIVIAGVWVSGGALSREVGLAHMKSDFVSNVSHELRTPLTSLRTNIELVRRADALAEAEIDEILSDVDSELRELSDLVTELVDLATDADRSEEPLQEVGIGALVEGVAERVRRRTGRTIDVTTDSNRISAWPSMATGTAWAWSPATAKSSGPTV